MDTSKHIGGFQCEDFIMCGIAAIFRYNGNGEAVDAAKWLRVDNGTQWKRGPDGEGMAFEGRNGGLFTPPACHHQPTYAGAQPIATLDGRLRIVYNGEIYNYKELRRDLQSRGCSFLSNSDTEVLLYLYQEEGFALVNRLRGMYAFALWDESRKGLLLVRDPLGIKPLYYSDDGHTIRVASRVKTILSAGGVDTSQELAEHVGFFYGGMFRKLLHFKKGFAHSVQARCYGKRKIVQ